MNGRVIAMTMANLPAAAGGTRTSPIDGRNLNKSFPGDVFGTPTSMIADYIERHLMSLSDLVLDLHSDGQSLRYLPSVTLVDHPDPDVQSRRLAMARAFGAENLLRFRSFEDRSTSGAARRAGATRIGTEIGGPDPVAALMAGITRILAWAGVISDGAPAAREAHLLLTQREDDFVYALADGVFEPAVRLGDKVSAGDLAGHIHDLTRPFATPAPVTFAVPGIVICTRGRGPAARGDCLMHLAIEADAEALAQLDEVADLRWLSTQVAPAAKRPRAGARRKPRTVTDRKPDKTTHHEE
jgi:predicted deacylase